MKRIVHSSMLSLLVMGRVGCSGEQQTQPDAVTEAPKEDAAVKDEPAAKEDGAADVYKQQAEALVAAIDAGKEAPEVLKLADELTQTGLSKLPDMIVSHPECKAYLEAIQAVGSTLKDLPLAEIETGYHADGKLPTMPSTDCYHGKDLVVHPATVAALAKAGLATAEDRAKAKGEIVEVLGHLGAIEPAADEQKDATAPEGK